MEFILINMMILDNMKKQILMTNLIQYRKIYKKYKIFKFKINLTYYINIIIIIQMILKVHLLNNK